jgi:hypothetical protein
MEGTVPQKLNITWITTLKLRAVIKPGADLLTITKTAEEVKNLTMKGVTYI